jgi:hypothetical protein
MPEVGWPTEPIEKMVQSVETRPQGLKPCAYLAAFAAVRAEALTYQPCPDTKLEYLN